MITQVVVGAGQNRKSGRWVRESGQIYIEWGRANLEEKRTE